jgi:apolipoprotein N-acyltransferase
MGGASKTAGGWLLALASGVLLCLSFPRYGSGLVAWAALVPLFLAVRSASPLRAFGLGWVAGFSGYVGILYWIVHVVVRYGHLPVAVGIPVMLLLAAYLGLYVSVFAGALAMLRKGRFPLLLAAPLLWTSLEYVKSHLLSGFPWANLGASQYLDLPLIQVTELTGVPGLTFLLVMANAALFRLCFDRGEDRRWLAEVLACLALAAAAHGYGAWRLGEVRAKMAAAPSLPVALVQGNIEQDVKWDPAYQQETVDIYTSLSRRTAPPRGGLVVWPETAAPFYFQDRNDLERQVIRLTRETGTWLILGSPRYERRGSEIVSFNSAFLVSPEGDIQGVYDKVHLVPYGEYVPFRRIIPFLTALTEGIGDFEAGAGYHPLAMGPHRPGVLICYEGILAGAGRSYKRQGADLLVNITNDAWFGRTSAPYQHLAMTVFRAVETRLSLVRAANTGISALIDPTGRITAQTGIFERTTLAGDAKFIDEQTFYGAYGDIFVYLCLGGTLVMIGFSSPGRFGRLRSSRIHSLRGRNQKERRT